VGTVEDRAVQLRRLQGILPSLGHQRPAHEGDLDQPVPNPEFSQGVRDIDLGVGVGKLSGAATLHLEARHGERSRDVASAFRVARNDEGHQSGRPGRGGPVGCGDLFLFARVGGGRQPARAGPQGRFQVTAHPGLVRQRRGGELQVSRTSGFRRAEPAEALPILRRLGQDQREALQQAADQRPEAAPGTKGAGRHAAVDQNQLDAAAPRGGQQIGPELGLHDQAQVGSPVLEKPFHRRGLVDRRELMDHPGRQTLVHEPCRGNRPRGQQELEIGPTRPQGLDQGQGGDRLAHAGGMKPDQAAGGPRASGPSEAFLHALRILAAAPLPLAHMIPDKGPGEASSGPIERQRA
jgi:hypothetical protein